jgi:hypothetical protein
MGLSEAVRFAGSDGGGNNNEITHLRVIRRLFLNDHFSGCEVLLMRLASYGVLVFPESNI